MDGESITAVLCEPNNEALEPTNIPEAISASSEAAVVDAPSIVSGASGEVLVEHIVTSDQVLVDTCNQTMIEVDGQVLVNEEPASNLL